jgi:superfamily I DNA and/or RNA helicase
VGEDLRGGLSKAIQDSLFERLFVDLETKEPKRVVTLQDQFRMHPVLGSFVSAEFYDNRLRNGIPRSAPFAHGLGLFGSAPAAWIEVPAAEGTEMEGRSKARTAEVTRIAELLPRLMASGVGKDLSFGVISFYSRQVSLLGKELARAGLMEADGNGSYQVAEDWRWLTKPNGEREPRLQVGTVDAFQGREFDVVFLSVTRSNHLPDSTPRQRQRKYGHLMSLNRLCVAMSRQKRLLIAVGDPELMGAANAPMAIGPLVRFHELCGGSCGLRL